jgi:hypothetical protein
MRRLLWLLARYTSQAVDRVLDAAWDRALDAVERLNARRVRSGQDLDD